MLNALSAPYSASLLSDTSFCTRVRDATMKPNRVRSLCGTSLIETTSFWKSFGVMSGGLTPLLSAAPACFSPPPLPSNALLNDVPACLIAALISLSFVAWPARTDFRQASIASAIGAGRLGKMAVASSTCRASAAPACSAAIPISVALASADFVMRAPVAADCWSSPLLPSLAASARRGRCSAIAAPIRSVSPDALRITMVAKSATDRRRSRAKESATARAAVPWPRATDVAVETSRAARFSAATCSPVARAADAAISCVRALLCWPISEASVAARPAAIAASSALTERST